MRVSALSLPLLVATSGSAHTKLAGQALRFQPNVTHSQNAFKVQGGVQTAKSRMGYLLEWYAPLHYKATVRGIPRSFSALESDGGDWVLYRQGRTCVIRTESFTVSCGSPGIWASLELSGRADLAPSTALSGGFITDDDATYKETDSREYRFDPQNRRVFPAIGSNGVTPIAVLEIRGPDYSKENKGEEYPILQLSPTFLSPMLARFRYQGELITLKAQSDLEIRPHRGLATTIISSRLEAFSGKSLVATFVRTESQPMGRETLPTPPQSISDLNALREKLSVEGQSFLQALLLTH